MAVVGGASERGKVMNVPNTGCFRVEGQHLMPVKVFIKNKASKS
jgi:hypothetical protein